MLFAAVVFTIGASREKSHHTETTATTPSPVLATGEAGETGGEAGRTDQAPSPAVAEHTDTGAAEGNVLGINVESTGVIALAALASAIVAGLVWFRSRRAIWALTAVFATVFAVFDIAETAHQANRSDTGLAILAGTVLALHAVAASTAVIALRWRATTPATNAVPV